MQLDSSFNFYFLQYTYLAFFLTVVKHAIFLVSFFFPPIELKNSHWNENSTEIWYVIKSLLFKHNNIKGKVPALF